MQERTGFGFQLVGVGDTGLTLRVPRGELKLLCTILEAGKRTDPALTEVTQQSTNSLFRKLRSLAGSANAEDTVEFVLTRRQFLDLSSIVEAVNVLDVDDHFADLAGDFPSDERLYAFTRHVAHIFERVFGESR